MASGGAYRSEREGWLLDAKPASTAFSPNRREVYSFDLEGRPLSWLVAGRTFKRTLASQVVGRSSEGGPRRRWRLDPGEAREHFERLLAVAGAAAAVTEDEAMAERLERILAWTPERLLAERARFDAAYRPIGILPPDQYSAVVLQATFGCSWNRCTFCTFYQDRPFELRTPEAFAAHVEAVSALLGRGEALRRSIFLADGNALVLSNARLEPLFEIARRAFPGRRIYGFVDVFGGERKSPGDWQELRLLGLDRVYVGLETGHDPLLSWLNKPGGRDDARAFTELLKAAGVRVSVIVMVGVGGDRFAAAHLRDTLALLADLPLTAGDLIYLSPFVEQQDAAYARLAAAGGIRSLTPAALAEQFEALRRGARKVHPQVRAVRYHLEEFLY